MFLSKESLLLYQKIVDAVTTAVKNILGKETTIALIENALKTTNSSEQQFKIKDASVDISSLSFSDESKLCTMMNSFLEKLTKSLSDALNPIVVSTLLSTHLKSTVEKDNLQKQIEKLDLDKKLLVLEGIIHR